MAKVGIVMGSDSDMPVMAKAAGFNDILLMDTYLLRILEEYYA